MQTAKNKNKGIGQESLSLGGGGFLWDTLDDYVKN